MDKEMEHTREAGYCTGNYRDSGRISGLGFRAWDSGCRA